MHKNLSLHISQQFQRDAQESIAQKYAININQTMKLANK